MIATRNLRFPVAALLLAAAGPAVASDFRGLLSVTAQWLLVAPWVLVALVVTLARWRDYGDAGLAWRHTRIAAIGPLLGFAAALLDPIERDLRSWLYGFDAIALALTSLPMLAHVLRASTRTPPDD